MKTSSLSHQPPLPEFACWWWQAAEPYFGLVTTGLLKFYSHLEVSGLRFLPSFSFFTPSKQNHRLPLQGHISLMNFFRCTQFGKNCINLSVTALLYASPLLQRWRVDSRMYTCTHSTKPPDSDHREWCSKPHTGDWFLLFSWPFLRALNCLCPDGLFGMRFVGRRIPTFFIGAHGIWQSSGNPSSPHIFFKSVSPEGPSRMQRCARQTSS